MADLDVLKYEEIPKESAQCGRAYDMAIDVSGQDMLPEEGFVKIEIKSSHPLMHLARALPWVLLMELVIKDLKATTGKGCWWMGRKIKVRVHLGAYLLQRLYNLTDRKVEYQVKDNAAFQLFCGRGIVEDWHVPDHTKIEEFRNRLSSETHRQLANVMAQAAVSLGFGDPSEVDFDSTVQEANISYPSDASLMTKLAGLGKKLVDFVRERMPRRLTEGLDVNMRAIKAKARDYFFLAKNKGIEIKREVFKRLHALVKHEMKSVVGLCEMLTGDQVASLPWNVRRAYEQIKNDAWRYLLDVAHFTRTHSIKAGKILSFHARALACIKKGKVGKELEFGRVFQLGRIKGNFLFLLESTSVQMHDRQSFIPLLKEHMRLFGEQAVETVATDKGYWSAGNCMELQRLGKCTEGLAKPSSIKVAADVDRCLQERLRNRRAGIEPLIGHLKQGGQLSRSRMKSDQATLGAAYGSVLGLNLRQIVRHQQGKMKIAA